MSSKTLILTEEQSKTLRYFLQAIINTSDGTGAFANDIETLKSIHAMLVERFEVKFELLRTGDDNHRQQNRPDPNANAAVRPFEEVTPCKQSTP